MSKVLSFEQAAARCAGKKLAHCHGVFDLLHLGHIRHFQAARALADALVVTVTEDAHVDKGPDRPVFREAERAEAIAALECVDAVVINRAPSAVPAIEALKPAFYVKGLDYKDPAGDRAGNLDAERAAVERHGGKLVFTDEPALSSTVLLKRAGLLR